MTKSDLKQLIAKEVGSQMKNVVQGKLEENPRELIQGATRIAKRAILEELIKEDPKRALSKNLHKIGDGDPVAIAKNAMGLAAALGATKYALNGLLVFTHCCDLLHAPHL